MKTFIPFLIYCLLFFQSSFSQENIINNPFVNVRLSILLFPTTPLLTIEVRTFSNVTIQVESNFANTHGINLKYYFRERLSESYLFTGIAFIENELLREDLQTTFLPYAGYGYAYRFGNRKQWTFDSRIGLGSTTNADSNSFYPVIKTGIGRIF
ncbi:hypothetical protein [Winogradskyella sp.]|uniref:hypothetical protein n=1 Tax=Winogradskyella sp. TaxID=1883156 RepID=UPI0026274070|nr:hypothetical protein [Winogradskyella sp.]